MQSYWAVFPEEWTELAWLGEDQVPHTPPIFHLTGPYAVEMSEESRFSSLYQKGHIMSKSTTYVSIMLAKF